MIQKKTVFCLFGFELFSWATWAVEPAVPPEPLDKEALYTEFITRFGAEVKEALTKQIRGAA